MSGYTDRFGGSQIQPSNVAYRLVQLTVDQQTYWPEFTTDGSYLARLMEVNASLGADILLPDATLAGPGSDVTFRNIGANAFNVLDANGSTIYSVLPGQAIYIYLTTNATKAGTWAAIQLGVGTSVLDLASAAGNGLVVASSKLAVSPIVSEVAGNTVISINDRAKMYIWKGGAGSFTLPLSSAVGQFYFGVRNQGSGALTVACTGGETIDGSSTIILQIGESCLIHASTGSWDTIGRGRATQFSFTQLQKAVTGGTVTLSLTEAANVVQTYTGALTSNVDIVVPAVVQVYYVSNQTTGAFNFRVKNPGTGQTVSLPTGQNAVLFSDGTNVINAATTVAGIGALLFGPGSAAAPSVGIGASTTGLYSANTGEVSVSSNGTKVAAIDGAGLRVVAPNSAIGAISPTGTASLVIDRPAGSVGALILNTATVARWTASVDNSAEAGANAGSSFAISRYSDVGALIDAPFSIDRKTGFVNVLGLRDLSKVGRIEAFVCDSTVLPPNCLLLDGSLISRATYAALWAYAQTTTPVSEAVWTASSNGRFSVGDGTTTFRLPDVRGTTIRNLDAGRGIDTGRTWGTDQAAQVLSHTHGVTDPTHAHSVYDPAHAHTGYTDAQGVHTHSSGIFANNTVTINAGFQANVASQANGNTDPAGNHQHNIQTYPAGTGIGIYAAYTGISIASAGGADMRSRNTAYPHYIRYQ